MAAYTADNQERSVQLRHLTKSDPDPRVRQRADIRVGGCQRGYQSQEQ